MVEVHQGSRVKIKDSGSERQYQVAGYLQSDQVILTDPYTSMIAVAAIHIDRLEVIPEVVTKSEAEKRGYSGTDIPCTSDEATEYFVFVMLQAGMMFERVPEDAREEVDRLLRVRGLSPSGPHYLAAMAYYDAAFKWYEDDRKQDETPAE